MESAEWNNHALRFTPPGAPQETKLTAPGTAPEDQSSAPQVYQNQPLSGAEMFAQFKQAQDD